MLVQICVMFFCGFFFFGQNKLCCSDKVELIWAVQPCGFREFEWKLYLQLRECT